MIQYIKTLFNRKNMRKLWDSALMSVVTNLVLLYVLYEVCRVVFLLVNWDIYADSITWDSFRAMLRGGWRFDTSAICYTNSLYLLLVFLPLHIKETALYQTITKWIYVVINSLCLLINLGDSVFFEFRGQRVTMAVFQEFQNEGNLTTIIWAELISHWYLVVLFVAMVFALVKMYRMPRPNIQRPLWRYYVRQVLTLAIVGFFAVCGMRGNVFFLSATRPISINYAFRYVEKPIEAGVVLNSPFSLIRTIGQTTINTPQYFITQEELDAVYSPVHVPAVSAEMRKKNVVIFMVESFAAEFIGGLNKDLDNGTYKGYTPWVDSMLDSCLYFEMMVDNAGFSIDAPPAILASIPRFDRPFVVSPHSVNHINSLASELKTWGYSTAFFHGADNESLGIQAFTRQAGFDQYFGKTEFYADSRFGGEAEFDGTWGVWDEPFLQFFCAELGDLPQPFLGGVFTLSSHHPFNVPDKYKDVFKDESDQALHKCIRYADHSLRLFFEEARKQPWFDNTIFVITADHSSSKRSHAEYKTVMGQLRVPILFYDPSGEMPRGCYPGVAQQIDIMPTLLNYMGYDKPYVAFGKDMLNISPEASWAFNWSDMPIYLRGDYLMIFDGEAVVNLYNYRTDPLLQHDIKGSGLAEEQVMTQHVKAVMQSYLQRMNADNVTWKE